MGSLPHCGGCGSVVRTVECDLADVVHDRPEAPDDSDFFAAPVVDPAEAFGVSDVGEDGLDGAHAVAVSLAGFGGADFVSHGLAMRSR